MSNKELVVEGPIFLSVKPVRGKPLMMELKENIRRMRNENVFRFYLNILIHSLYVSLDMMLRF